MGRKAAAQWLQRSYGTLQGVVVLQNGVEHYQRVAPLAGQATVLPAIVWRSAEAVATGRVRLRGEPRLSVPEGEPGRRLARLLDGAARVDLMPDFFFVRFFWLKCCLALSENAAACRLVRLPGLARFPGYRIMPGRTGASEQTTSKHRYGKV